MLAVLRRGAAALHPWHSPRATVWRGRDDPMGENAEYIEYTSLRLPEEKKTEVFTPVNKKLGKPSESALYLIERQYKELDLKPIYAKLALEDAEPNIAGPIPGELKLPPEKPLFTEALAMNMYQPVFEDHDLPMFVDLCSGEGRALMLLAKRNKKGNYLGFERKLKHSKYSKRVATELSLLNRNLDFVDCNPNLWFDKIINEYAGPLGFVTVMWPLIYRWQSKMQIIKWPLVHSILKHLIPGGRIYFQTHDPYYAKFMRDHFDPYVGKYIEAEEEDDLKLCDEYGWLRMNPLGVKTEQEIQAESEGIKMYRRLYTRLEEDFLVKKAVYKRRNLPPILLP